MPSVSWINVRWEQAPFLVFVKVSIALQCLLVSCHTLLLGHLSLALEVEESLTQHFYLFYLVHSALLRERMGIMMERENGKY